jgi:deazaflavin-dependent oxidoreductase (nitroreductase family)
MAAQTPRPWTPSEERFGTLAVRAMSAVNTWIFRASGGRLGSRFRYGAPVLLLTTTGRKSGERRTTPLIYLDDRAGIVLVASKGGMSHSPGWYHNLMAQPECEVQIGGETSRMLARRASAAEKQALWPKLVAIYRDYDDYQARTTRDIPVVILTERDAD